MIDVVVFSVATPQYPDAVAVIDVADAGLVFDGRGDWKARQCGRRSRDLYVCRYRRGSGRGSPDEKLHRLIMSERDPEVLVDHRNGDTLNCRRNNLRRASHAGNMRNRAQTQGRSLPKGVMAWRGKYRAKITVNRHCIHLGLFETVTEAAAAYDAAARLHFGEFARPNQEKIHA